MLLLVSSSESFHYDAQVLVLLVMLPEGTAVSSELSVCSQLLSNSRHSSLQSDRLSSTTLQSESEKYMATFNSTLSSWMLRSISKLLSSSS